MSKHFNWLSGNSYGSIMAGALSHGYGYAQAKQMHIDFPGDEMMEKQVEWENAPWLKKITHFFDMKAGMTSIYPQWIKFFRMNFSWEKVSHANRVFIGFALTEEVGRLVGLPRLSYLDYIRLMRGASKRVPFGKFRQLIRAYYASHDGIYCADAFTGELRRISNDVIPMADAILASFSNPILGKWTVKFNGKSHGTIDGGVVNNHANLPFAGSGQKYQQAICNVKAPSIKYWEEKNILSAYYYYKTTPESVWHFPPLTSGLAFFQFGNPDVLREFDGRDVSANGYLPQDMGENWSFCGGAADGMGYSPFYKTASDLL